MSMFGKRYKSAVLEIINRAKEYAPTIGKYCDHSILEESEIVVRLTNGKLSMPVEAAIKQDSLPYSLKEDWVKSIAGTFEEKMLVS
jgi:hypothetical protein